MFSTTAWVQSHRSFEVSRNSRSSACEAQVTGCASTAIVTVTAEARRGSRAARGLLRNLEPLILNVVVLSRIGCAVDVSAGNAPLTGSEIEQFRATGFLTLPSFLTLTELEEVRAAAHRLRGRSEPEQEGFLFDYVNADGSV